MYFFYDSGLLENTNKFLKSIKSYLSGNRGTKCLRKKRELEKYIGIKSVSFITNYLSHDINNLPATESVNVVNYLVLQTSYYQRSNETERPGGI